MAALGERGHPGAGIVPTASPGGFGSRIPPALPTLHLHHGSSLVLTRKGVEEPAEACRWISRRG